LLFDHLLSTGRVIGSSARIRDKVVPMPLRFAAVCGLLAPVTFLVGIVLGGLAQPDAFSSANDDISDLGALTASQAWFYNRIATNLTGLLIVLFALGLWRMVGRSTLGRVGSATLVVMGTGQFLDGMFRLDCRGIDAGCVNESWHATAHRVESGFTSAALFLAPIILAFAFRRLRVWRPIWIPTLAAMPAVIVASIAGSAFGAGAAARAGAVVWFAWVALVAAWLYHLAPAREA
jgi:hypothetical protein